MRKFILDFVFDENTGECKIVVDFQDQSMSAFEMNQAVRDGEIREEVLALIEKVFDESVANDVRGGKTQMICLDDHPEERERVVQQPQQQQQPDDFQKRENLQ